MANIKLPTERSVVTDFDPRLLVLFGKPKSGKSTLMASLDSNLIIDLEDGYRALSVMAVQARSYVDLTNIVHALIEKVRELGRNPYRYITIDNATRLEEMAVPYAAKLYRETPMGVSFGLMKDASGNLVKGADGKFVVDPRADVRTLPNGGGWLYMRKAVTKLINMFKPYTDHLILIAHVKEKQIRMESTEMNEMSVDLAGKISDIICGEADAVGYIYREDNKTVVSFKGGDSTIREARPLHLRGKNIVVAQSDEDGNVTVDMSSIFKCSKKDEVSSTK